MDNAERKKLFYRRQYLILPKGKAPPMEALSFPLGRNLLLHAHPDLEVNAHKGKTGELVLLGDLFDYRNPGKSNMDILRDLAGFEKDAFLEALSAYAGRYVFIWMNHGQMLLVSDATATKKVYYSHLQDGIAISSQSHLLALAAGFTPSEDPSKKAFYASEDFKKLDHASIGCTTYYDEISQLMPNHYLDAENLSVHRFWPAEKLEKRGLEDVVGECGKMIKGYMEAICQRYPVMLPVTAGNDSRMLLAGTRDIREDIYHYINLNPGKTEQDTDIRIPGLLLDSIGRAFHIQRLDQEIDPGFESLFFEMNPLASSKYLPHIYNYYRNFQDRVNLPGNYAAHPMGLHRLAEKNVNATNLANLYRPLARFEHALNYYGQWIEESRNVCRESNIDMLRLNYWEERIGNWGTQIQLDKDIAQADINPLNSRGLMELFFSVEGKYNMLPTKIINKKIIGALWPELLEFAINPSMKKRLFGMLATSGLLKYLVWLRYPTARVF